MVWLAARESLYRAKIERVPEGKPLRFTNLGIVPRPCNGDFLYDVDCTPEKLKNDRPRVTYLGPYEEEV